MASSSGRDPRPDALSRLRSEPAPRAPEVGVDVLADDDRTASSERVVEGSSGGARREPEWGATPPPRWLDEVPDGDVVDARSERSASLRRSPARRLPFVAPPAAIALIAVGVLACVVTAYSVLRGPSDDSPAAARVAFPASAGAAAPSASTPGESGRPTAVGTASASSAARPAPADELVVSVVGLVRTPGLVRLTGSARVADAIARAGGGRPGADLLSLNMAQPVRDGDQILVGFADPGGGAGMRSAIVSASSGSGTPGAAVSPGSAASPATTGAPGSASGGDGAPVNLNTADEAALDTLPGVGPVTAKAIIDWRSRNGGFTSVDQLAEVDGIGPGRLAKLRDRVTV